MRFGAISIFAVPFVAATGPVPKTRVDPVRKDSQVGYLFHVSEDPYESTNVYSDDSYADVLSYVQERTDYWSSYVIDPQMPPDTDKKPYWKAAGGVVPWVESDYVPPRVPELYDYKEAPNIVFVLVDDWGWNDVGFRSTYMSWTTPTIDNLAAEGISLENYYTAYSCIPARGAFLTGRYPIRLGLWESGEGAELPLNETTLGQEMKSAGYRTYMIGKWHLGYSTNQHTPTMRGFDYYYGYWNGYVDYWTKEYGDYLDLHEGIDLVSDDSEIDATLHNAYLLQSKAEMVIKDHAENFADEPMFLYYAMQLIHGVWSAPQSFLDRCGSPTDDATDDYVQSVEYNYCALNVLLDEAIANLTCTLNQYGMSDNTILLIVSDNGGETTVQGNSYPWRGQKGAFYKGGMMGTAIVHSKLLPDDIRGTTYDGYMHVTDWMPTLMGLATGGIWKGSLFDHDLDGVDMWDAITTGGDSPRTEMVHYHDGVSETSITVENYKLNLNNEPPGVGTPAWVFDEDQNPDAQNYMCEDPSLMDDDDSNEAVDSSSSGKKTRRSSSPAMSSSSSSSSSDPESESGTGSGIHRSSISDIIALTTLGAVIALTVAMSAKATFSLKHHTNIETTNNSTLKNKSAVSATQPQQQYQVYSASVPVSVVRVPSHDPEVNEQTRLL